MIKLITGTLIVLCTILTFRIIHLQNKIDYLEEKERDSLDKHGNDFSEIDKCKFVSVRQGEQDV